MDVFWGGTRGSLRMEGLLWEVGGGGSTGAHHRDRGTGSSSLERFLWDFFFPVMKGGSGCPQCPVERGGLADPGTAYWSGLPFPSPMHESEK